MSEKRVVRFDSNLLHYIRLGWDDVAQSLLTSSLCNASDNWGTLLHYAAVYGNATIARRLIDLGSDVDFMGRGCRTPLMVAVGRNRDATAKVLLEAKADLDVVNADGKSALQMVFDARFLQPEILEAFYERLTSDTPDREQLAKRLIQADCSLYHAAFLGDLRLIECMLEREVYVDSMGPQCRTALHAAAELNDLRLARLLVANGADVNAIDQNGTSVLFVAVSEGNAGMLRLLLERGADANAQDVQTGRSPLYVVFANSRGEDDEEAFDECAELLLRYGAVPSNSPDDSYTIFDFAMINESYNRVDLLIAHLVMRGESIDEVMRCNVDEHRGALASFAVYQGRCRRILRTRIVGKLTLLDLLTAREDEMRRYARNLTLVERLRSFYGEYDARKMFPYYYRMLEERVREARYLVGLEDLAIPKVCDILSGNYNECYIVARKVVGYMNRRELEVLYEV